MAAKQVLDVSLLNAKQKQSLEQLVSATSDCKIYDWDDEYKRKYLLKWLIVCDFDWVQAEMNLRATIVWRQNNLIDSIDKWIPPKVMTDFYPIGFTGHDKYGCPVWVQRFGRTDLKGLMESVTKREYLHYFAALVEMGVRGFGLAADQAGKLALQQTLVMDMDGLSMWQLACKSGMEVQMEGTKMFETHFPENYRKVFVVNAPKLFGVFFAMIKPFMFKHTVAKFHIYGTNADEWRAALLEDIDADQLPAEYGGTLTDPDGNAACLTKVVAGGEIPDSFYRTKSKPQPRDGMEKISVSKGSKRIIEFNFQVPNSILRYEFMSEEGDVGFRVFYLEEDKKVEVVPWQRIDSHLMMESGAISCWRSTTYIVEFDNSFSYLRSKTVWYSLKVEEPAE